MSRKYVLNEAGEPVKEDDVFAWAMWFETADRHIAQDRVGPYRISTIFLGIDHDFVGRGKPVLFETMIFSDAKDGDEVYCERYTSRAAALEGHEYALDLALGMAEKP